MKFIVLLPNVDLWGGVKRFLELGNRIIAKGHSFIIASPCGERPVWFPYCGDVCSFADIPGIQADVAMCTEVAFLPELLSCQVTLRIFYHVLQSVDLRPVLQYPGIKIFVNSTNLYRHNLRRYGIESFKAIGGVDTGRFIPVKKKTGDEITILSYGRIYRKRKGTRFVIKACERLYRRGYPVKLLLFDTPIDSNKMKEAQAFTAKVPFEFILNHPVMQTQDIYARADIFASAEKNAGWANTCAEAMATGLPVVATQSGSRDILIHNKTGLVVWRNSWSIERALNRLIESPELRYKLGTNARDTIGAYDWSILSEKILNYVCSCL
jgi:glycosyltransferase involved in cell wall biosynthesis